MEIGDLLSGVIIDLTEDGRGILRESGVVVFTDKGVIGDFVSVAIVEKKKNFLVGEVLDIIEKSKDRIESDCKVFGKCGGCDFRDFKYSAQTELKKNFIEKAMRKVAGVKDFVLDDFIPAENIIGYRNNIQMPISKVNGKLQLGFYEKGSSKIVSFEECKLIPKELNEFIVELKEFIETSKIPVVGDKGGILKHIGLRINRKGEICLIFVMTEKFFSKSENSENIKKLEKLLIGKNVVSVYENLNKGKLTYSPNFFYIYGKKKIEDQIGKYRFKLSPGAFFQVNREQTEKLYNKAIELSNLKESDVLMDLYSGVGTIGISAAKSVKKVVGIEYVKSAVIDAKQNASLNNISNAEFIAGDVEKILSETVKKYKPNKLILDPPRTGVDKTSIETIAKQNFDSITYVSCNPQTLARDVKVLMEHGYKIDKTVGVDMFPFTGHVETVCLMSKV